MNEIIELINNYIGIISDDRFEGKTPKILQDIDANKLIMGLMSELYEEKTKFFDDFDYKWALELNNFNSITELQLQYFLLNIISDINVNNININNRGNIIVRFLHTSMARSYVKSVGNSSVVVLTTGYFICLKGFLRVLLSGSALGSFDINSLSTLNLLAENLLVSYRTASKDHQDILFAESMHYIINISALMNDSPPIISRSVFDSIVNKNHFELLFSWLCMSSDSFVMLHEVAHSLNKDMEKTQDYILQEILADRDAISLSIVDQSRNKNPICVICGASLFFSVELVRTLIEEFWISKKENRDGEARNHDNYQSTEQRIIKEIKLRMQFLDDNMRKLFGEDSYVYKEFMNFSKLCWDTVNTFIWTLLKFDSSTECNDTLADYIFNNAKL
jgi:hypothetical protein